MDNKKFITEIFFKVILWSLLQRGFRNHYILHYQNQNTIIDI